MLRSGVRSCGKASLLHSVLVAQGGRADPRTASVLMCQKLKFMTHQRRSRDRGRIRLEMQIEARSL